MENFIMKSLCCVGGCCVEEENGKRYIYSSIQVKVTYNINDCELVSFEIMTLFS